jgi:HlyD family secretion protein
MKKLLVLLVLLAVAGAGGAWWFGLLGGAGGPVFRTEKVKRGDIQATVSATGTLEPQELVDVSAQVNGQVLELGFDPHDPEKDPRKRRRIDWRTEVDEGTLLARLDDKLYRARVVQARGNLVQCEANVELCKAKLTQAERDWRRAQQMYPRGGISSSDYDAAHYNYETCKAALEVARAAVEVAKGQLQEAETNLGYTEIRSPVKGVIIDKRVNPGQTVITNLNAQSLFLVAKDLALMEIWAAVNEADLGQIHPGQAVRFTVASDPTREYRGTVRQIRYNATNNSNVVTYTVVVGFDNRRTKLMPYLTATLQFEVAQRKDVLYLPNAVLRWRPLLRHVEETDRARWERYLRKGPGDADKSGILRVGDGDQHDHVIVWVANEHGLLEAREIQVGQSDGRVTEVVGGLSEGDEVVWGVDQRKANKGPDNPFLPRFNKKDGGQ